jgi:ubiquinone/menaquinone biosynthesis C-methylase UbiE
MANIEYTNKWTNNSFNAKKVNEYDRKFYVRFEKNIKHRQQINLIKKYLKETDKWLDAPIGSGRLMDAIKHDNSLCNGFDISDSFIEWNNNKGIECFKGDLFELNIDKKFDIITSMHTIFAFKDFKKILNNYTKLLEKNGYLIVDIVNNDLYNKFPFDKKHDKSIDSINGMTLDEIELFFNELNCDLIELIPHDYFDSEYVLDWKYSGNYLVKKVKNLIWRVANKLYFKLNLFPLFDLLEDREKIEYFNKYLVVVRKR